MFIIHYYVYANIIHKWAWWHDYVSFLIFLLLLRLIISPFAIILPLLFISFQASFPLTLGHLQLHFFFFLEKFFFERIFHLNYADNILNFSFIFFFSTWNSLYILLSFFAYFLDLCLSPSWFYTLVQNSTSFSSLVRLKR